MSLSQTIALIGALLLALGIALFVYATEFAAPYAGASGGGMAGLHNAMLAILGLVLITFGGAVALVSYLVHMGQKRRREAGVGASENADGA